MSVTVPASTGRLKKALRDHYITLIEALYPHGFSLAPGFFDELEASVDELVDVATARALDHVPDVVVGMKQKGQI